MNLTDRRVVITGAGRDFGRALAHHFAGLGAELFLAARSLQAAERPRSEIRDRATTACTPSPVISPTPPRSVSSPRRSAAAPTTSTCS